MPGLLAVAVTLGACAGASAPEVLVDDPQLEQGRDIYVRQCSSCHGSTGGGGRGSKLDEGRVIRDFPDIDSQIELVTAGRNSMPSFSGKLTTDEIVAVVRYTREVLS